MYVTLRGQVDAIILTGGIAHSDYCVGILKEQIDYLAPVVLMPVKTRWARWLIMRWEP